ncbi:M15 family metallopeptidase [Pseudoflavonifractor hominis]|uniref:D-alanyl-D-alanine dipeptidase n=1 Tax=Pseudoflavonifractor hominis TaxID=2763059 RepID=A0ABR7HX44_9FIRM|nr:M15 family metallopeptidase [Pseudoflavonifractor hominis]MBC5731996.1 D-alanyl-D-alanine dipeptidase [Pseudoflavonifractor hominis]
MELDMERVWRDQQRPIPWEEDPDLSDVPAPQDCGEALLDVTDLHPRIRFDRAYQKRGLRGAMDRCLMREGVWKRLCQVVEGLPACYSLLIYDCLRPLTLQKAIYEEFEDIVRARTPGLQPEEVERILSDFVAKPVKRRHAPAPHTTGGAVDLTLCKNGVPLDMGTGFDDLTPAAHTHWVEEHPENQAALENRRLLFHRMTGAGFINYCTEWWHFAYGERMWAHAHGTAPKYGFCPECDFPEER